MDRSCPAEFAWKHTKLWELKDSSEINQGQNTCAEEPNSETQYSCLAVGVVLHSAHCVLEFARSSIYGDTSIKHFASGLQRKHLKYSSLKTDQQDVYVRLFCFSSSDFKNLVNLMFFLPLFSQIRCIMRVVILARNDLHTLQQVLVLLTPLLGTISTFSCAQLIKKCNFTVPMFTEFMYIFKTPFHKGSERDKCLTGRRKEL